MKELLDIFIVGVAGLVAGLIVSYIPYVSFVAIPVFIILTIILIGRLMISTKFRESPKSKKNTYFFTAFWIIVLFFFLRPTGLKTMLPVMDIENEKVSVLLYEWGNKFPNIEFDCENIIEDKTVSIHTITPISVGEALDLISKKTNSNYQYRQVAIGRSISNGPHIRVTLEKNPEGKDKTIDEPYIFDAY